MPNHLNKSQSLRAWTAKKDKLHHRTNAPAFQEHEVWWCSLGENIQSETNGKHTNFERPVIIIKKLSNNMAVVVPCTGQQKTGSWYFPIIHPRGRSTAVMSQIRTVSNHRLLRKIGSMSAADFGRLKVSLAALLT